MLAVIEALAPVFLIIVLGFVLKRMALFEEAAWTGFENICYFILFPVLLVKTLATAEISAGTVLRFSSMLLFVIASMSALLFLLRPLLRRYLGMTPAAFSSLFQGTTRWHGFIALAMVGLLLGDEGVAYVAVTMAVLVPVLNVLNVWVLATHGEHDSDLGSVLRHLARNPFIIACAIGATLNLSGLGLGGSLYRLFDILGGGALGLSLLTVGAGLRFANARAQKGLVLTGSALRLIGMPLLMFAGCWLFGIEGTPRTVAVIAGAVPTAASTFVLARQMGGDAVLMANLITVQVLMAIATLPAMIWLAGISA